jgi:hypothetical protein
MSIVGVAITVPFENLQISHAGKSCKAQVNSYLSESCMRRNGHVVSPAWRRIMRAMPIEVATKSNCSMEDL